MANVLVAFPTAGLTFNWNTELLPIPNNHPFNTYFGLIGFPNALQGTRDHPIASLQALGFTLSIRNPNNVNELDNVFYGLHGLDVDGIMLATAQAINAGFSHGVVSVLGSSREARTFEILRKAMIFAKANPSNLYHLLATDFYALPAMAAATANLPRFKISYSLLVESSTLLMKTATEFIGLSGAVHSLASRANNSRFATFFDTVVDHLSNPPVANQPMAVANAILRSGLPPSLSVYPLAAGDRYTHLMLRLHYIGGTFAQRRAGFILYYPLLCGILPVLATFLLPADSDDQSVDAYSLMANSIYVTLQPPAQLTLFHLEAAGNLQDQLVQMPEVPQGANALVPVGDAAYRSRAAVQEFDRRRGVVANAQLGTSASSAVVPGGQQIHNVTATRSGKQQLMTNLLPLPFFPQANMDIIRLHAANPANEFPWFMRAVSSRNVIFLQVSIGRLRGVGDVADSLRILEGASSSFAKFVDHTTVMDKPPLATAGTRPETSLLYNQEEFTKSFLTHNRESFLKLDIRTLCHKIKCTRKQMVEKALPKLNHLFESAETVALLKYFSHYLEAFGFVASGPGSFEDGLNRLELLRNNGMGMSGDSLTHHLKNCTAAYLLLLGDLFDAMSHFTQQREAPNVGLALSTRVFEVGGAFDRHLAYQDSATSSLNALLLLNPAFERAMGGSSSASGGGEGGKGAHQGSPGGGKSKAKTPYHWQKGGSLRFGSSANGPTYATSLCWEELKKIDPKLSPSNFCMVNYLSTQADTCKSPKHHPGSSFHKISTKLQELRPKFESAPFRTDAKAK